MSWRIKAESAIRRWNALGFDQKLLASLARVHPTVITHVRDYPDFTIKEATAERIVAVVEAEEAKLISSLEMKVFAYCHGATVPSACEDKQLIVQLKESLAGGCDGIQMPHGAGAALLEITMKAGKHGKARCFVVVLAPGNSDYEKRALAHELGHLQAELLKDLDPPDEPPKSAF